MLLELLAFGLIALAANQIGTVFGHFRLPRITGYLVTGIFAGPFILEFMSVEVTHDLHFVEQFSLAIIAFAAGSELYFKELRSRLKSIAWVTAGLVIVTHLIGSITVFMVADSIPFMQDLPPASRIAAAMLVGAIMVARSPSSAIAIVNELRARGTFTKTILGVTVFMDLVVIVVFAIDSSLADTLITSSSPSLAIFVLLVGEIALALLAGIIIGKLLEALLARHWDARLKAGGIVLIGFSVFIFSGWLRAFSHNELPFEVFLEPLLICVIASLFVTNGTRFRDEFAKILHDIGPIIYVIFFTLTGASLSLDIFLATWPIALLLFAVRLSGVIIGSFVGGTVAGDPSGQNRLLWMGFVTQAGVALGLAREVAAEFPVFGDAFATMIISVIVINETVGPILFKAAIRRMGEAHLPAQAEPDRVRDVLILGMGGQSQALAQQLARHNWQVIIADTDPDQIQLAANSELQTHCLLEISRDELAEIITTSTDALVVMLGDDAQNLQACELAYEHFGIPRVVARLNDYTLVERFRQLGVHVVYPASAMVHLLDQFVRAPQTAALLLEEHPESEIVQITVTDPDIDNLPLRDLRLPADVLVLSITRDGTLIVPHGHTVIKRNDEVTLIGSPQHLEAVTLRLGF